METDSTFKVKINVGVKDDKSGRFLLPLTDFETVVTPPRVDYSSYAALQLRCEALARELWSNDLWRKIDTDAELSDKLGDREDWTIVAKTIKIIEIAKKK